MHISYIYIVGNTIMFSKYGDDGPIGLSSNNDYDMNNNSSSSNIHSRNNLEPNEPSMMFIADPKIQIPISIPIANQVMNDNITIEKEYLKRIKNKHHDAIQQLQDLIQNDKSMYIYIYIYIHDIYIYIYINLFLLI